MQRISSASHISHFLTERNNKIINIYSNASIQPDTTVTKTLLCVNSKYPNKVNLQILNASIIKIKKCLCLSVLLTTFQKLCTNFSINFRFINTYHFSVVIIIIPILVFFTGTENLQ